MKKFTAIVVDDITEALEMLCHDIEKHHPEIEIIGKASSVISAAKLLQKNHPDILFLDIKLGDGTGFDILEIVSNLQSKIIFVTASDEYAIKAFKFAAIDYILKPYSNEDLANSIKKATEQIQPNKEQIAVLQESIKNTNKVSEIIRCNSDNNYTTFHLKNGKKILVSKTLKYYADMLKEHQFLRVHQSHLINTSYIKEFIKSDGGYLILKDKSNIPVSVRKRNEVIETLNNLK
jgi:two-component system LytT family response regulator